MENKGRVKKMRMNAAGKLKHEALELQITVFIFISISNSKRHYGVLFYYLKLKN